MNRLTISDVVVVVVVVVAVVVVFARVHCDSFR